MTAAHTYLVETLDRVADGGDVTMQELDVAIPDPLVLNPCEKAAWEQLSHWADDGDIRARDQRYAESQRERMRDHLSALLSDHWDPYPPTVRQRLVNRIWLAAYLIVVASNMLGWKMFGEYDKKVMIALSFVGVVILLPIARLRSRGANL